MVLTRLEKLAFVLLITMLAMGIMMLIVRVTTISNQNALLLKQIDHIAGLTDQTVLVKGSTFNETENAGKLNLNRTDLKSIRALPEMTPTLAKRVHDYIKEKGEIKDMNELLNVQGMTKRRLRALENYATVIGGHSGHAAWGDKLNLNFASEAELNALPGVSKKMAEKIIEFRNRNGGFFSIEDLKEVPGVTEKALKQFSNLVEVK